MTTKIFMVEYITDGVEAGPAVAIKVHQGNNFIGISNHMNTSY
jgi:hypothetical protein